jgi:hypothetical protein
MDSDCFEASWENYEEHFDLNFGTHSSKKIKKNSMML